MKNIYIYICIVWGFAGVNNVEGVSFQPMPKGVSATMDAAEPFLDWRVPRNSRRFEFANFEPLLLQHDPNDGSSQNSGHRHMFPSPYEIWQRRDPQQL